jgi:hypothetical protein
VYATAFAARLTADLGFIGFDVLAGPAADPVLKRLSRRLTMGTNEPVAPAGLLQVGGAGRVVGEKLLELW